MIRYPACGTPPHRRVPAFCDIANIGRDDITPPHSVGPVDTWIRYTHLYPPIATRTPHSNPPHPSSKSKPWFNAK